jgi:hypothetical protein
MACRRHPVIVFDDWWSLDYARTACEFQGNLQEAIPPPGAVPISPDIPPPPPGAVPIQQPAWDLWCLDPTVSALNYENRIEAAFAAEPACRGVTLAHWTGPHSSKEGIAAMERRSTADWLLIIDLGPDSRDGPVGWGLVNARNNTSEIFTSMEAQTPHQLVRDACQIARRIGGSVH